MGGARKPPGPTKFHPWEFPRSGGKAIDVERREREERSPRKPPGPKPLSVRSRY